MLSEELIAPPTLREKHYLHYPALQTCKKEKQATCSQIFQELILATLR